jgi:hypothetical protein
MKWIALLALLPCSAVAQDFGTPPVLDVDGLELRATLTDACVNAQAARGPAALVSAAAGACIGLSADDADGPAVSRADRETAYWEWRIAQNYRGLQAWLSDKPESAELENLRASVANPAAATANVALECELRVGLQDTPDTAALDIARCEMRETALIALELEFTVRQACQDATSGAFAAFCGTGKE